MGLPWACRYAHHIPLAGNTEMRGKAKSAFVLSPGHPQDIQCLQPAVGGTNMCQAGMPTRRVWFSASEMPFEQHAKRKAHYPAMPTPGGTYLATNH